MRTGFIGLGAMGSGMASNLARAGLLTAVYNRTPGTAITLAAELQVRAYDTIAALAETVDVVISCVSADSDVMDVISQLSDSLQPGSVVIDCSTISSETAQRAAELLAGHQIAFLDAPVSGGVEGARLGKLSMMVGGDPSVLEQVQPILAAISSRIVHLGANGAGQACKAVNQIMAAGINQAVCEALAFAEAQGLDLDKVIDVVSAGAAGNWFLQHRGHNMAKGLYMPGFKLALHHKDLLICQAMARKTAVACPLTDASLDDYANLIEQGHGDDDISGLFHLKLTHNSRNIT